MDKITTAIELQEEFHAFKAADRRGIEEIQEVITAIEERVSILCRSQDGAWEHISDKVTSDMDRASAMLSERVAEVEQAMQTRSASPATTVEQNPTFHEDKFKQDLTLG